MYPVPHDVLCSLFLFLCSHNPCGYSTSRIREKIPLSPWHPYVPVIVPLQSIRGKNDVRDTPFVESQHTNDNNNIVSYTPWFKLQTQFIIFNKIPLSINNFVRKSLFRNNIVADDYGLCQILSKNKR